jgi:adenylate cyclase
MGLQESDVTDELPRVVTPTLIMHARKDRQFGLDESRVVAAAMPDARLVPIDAWHAYFFSWHQQIVPRMLEFLDAASTATLPATATPPPIRTVLFTDVVRNTPLLVTLGDAAWREIMREHESIVRDALAAHGGDEISTAGDSFFASFNSTAGALRCSIDLQRALAQRNETAEHAIDVRVGLNAGEPIADGKDLFGTAVTLAARIMSEADAGQILVHDVVRQLVAGKGFQFKEHGEFIPKGMDEPVRLFEVLWNEARP